jgi:DNA gyrase/topoisomerase IV subunit A
MPIEKIPSNQTRKPLLPLNDDEKIVTILDIANENNDLLVYTSDGLGKRFSVSDLNLVQSVDAQGQFIINDHEVAGIFSINPNKPLLLYVTRLSRLRVNHMKYLPTSNKFGSIKNIIPLSPQDDLVAVFKNPEVEFGYMRGIPQRMVINRGVITEIGDVVYKGNDAVAYDLTITALTPDGGGNKIDEYIGGQ